MRLIPVLCARLEIPHSELVSNLANPYMRGKTTDTRYQVKQRQLIFPRMVTLHEYTSPLGLEEARVVALLHDDKCDRGAVVRLEGGTRLLDRPDLAVSPANK